MRRDWAATWEDRNYAIRRETDLRHLSDVLWALLGLGLLAAVLVFQSWSRSRIVDIGYESQRLQSLEESLLRSQKTLIVEEATLKDPARIAGLARNLGLAPVRAAQLLPSYRPEGPTQTLASTTEGADHSVALASTTEGADHSVALATPSRVAALAVKKVAASN
jgi:cell division protein FtsL